MKVLGFLLVAALLASALVFWWWRRPTPTFDSPLGTTVVPAIEQLRSVPLVYGYLPYWNINKAQFPSVLTHLAYFSLPIRSDGHLLPQETQDPGYRLYSQGVLEDLRDRAPQAKIELVLTMMDQEAIPTFLASPSATQNLIADLKAVIASHPIAGVNIDIEYIRGVNETKRSQFSQLLQTMNLALKPERPNFHLSVAVLADSAEKQRLTDIKTIAPLVDHIVIMAYDFHRKASSQSGANAPLYGKGDDAWDKNIMSSAKMFTDLVPAKKLILGVPFYGYEWSVTASNPYNFTLPDSGMMASYGRITKLLASGKATRYWDSASYTPYLLYTENGTQQQIYYEDSQSLTYKLELVKQAGLGGIAIWALGYEGNTQELWQTIAQHL